MPLTRAVGARPAHDLPQAIVSRSRGACSRGDSGARCDLDGAVLEWPRATSDLGAWCAVARVACSRDELDDMVARSCVGAEMGSRIVFLCHDTAPTSGQGGYGVWESTLDLVVDGRFRRVATLPTYVSTVTSVEGVPQDRQPRFAMDVSLVRGALLVTEPEPGSCARETNGADASWERSVAQACASRGRYILESDGLVRAPAL